jgi:hypothetical protein
LKGLFRHKKTTHLTVLLKNFSAVAIEKLAKFENGKIGSSGKCVPMQFGAYISLLCSSGFASTFDGTQV